MEIIIADEELDIILIALYQYEEMLRYSGLNSKGVEDITKLSTKLVCFRCRDQGEL